MSTRVVLFDLDGTLIDSGHLYAESYRRAFASELDVPPTFEEMLARRPSSERLFLRDWYGPELGDRIHQRMVETYEELAAELLGGFFVGVPELIAALSASDVRMGIVTGKSRRAFEVTARYVDFARFEVVVLEDDVPHPKPHPAGIRRALAALGATPDQAIYVGDTPTDVEAARRAGMIAASALWGRRAEDRARIAAAIGEAAWALSAPTELLDRF